MRAESGDAFVTSLASARRELLSVADAAEGDIGVVASGFQVLAALAATVLERAAAVVQCVEDESVGSMLPVAQALGSTARQFVKDRLQATTGILGTITLESTLLRQLSLATRSQNAIALKTRVMTVLTNVEAARLGVEGAGFQHLAMDLANFSSALTRDTEELSHHIEERRPLIERMRAVLSEELPKLELESARIDTDMGEDLAALEAGLHQVASTPVQFRACVEEIAQQIDGVVAAVQSHDITRQQLEHVQEALALLSSPTGHPGRAPGGLKDPAIINAGLAIQLYQLKNVQATASEWTHQIDSCMSGILGVSASGLAGISPLVLEQEKGISASLAHIDLLERQSHACSEKIRRTVGKESNLLHLVAEHVERAKSIRYRLHLLSLNSIVEASRLGNRADAILEIAKIIADIASEWSDITTHAETVMQEILGLVRQTDAMMETFSESHNAKLRDAQTDTRRALENLRKAAAFAAAQSDGIASVTEKMQARSTEAADGSHSLAATYARLHGVLEMINDAKHQYESEHPHGGSRHDPHDMEQVERLFSSSYTTEIERAVMRAALHGTAMPAPQPDLAGSSVELF